MIRPVGRPNGLVQITGILLWGKRSVENGRFSTWIDSGGVLGAPRFRDVEVTVHYKRGMGEEPDGGLSVGTPKRQVSFSCTKGFDGFL